MAGCGLSCCGKADTRAILNVTTISSPLHDHIDHCVDAEWYIDITCYGESTVYTFAGEEDYNISVDCEYNFNCHIIHSLLQLLLQW